VGSRAKTAPATGRKHYDSREGTIEGTQTREHYYPDPLALLACSVTFRPADRELTAQHDRVEQLSRWVGANAFK